MANSKATKPADTTNANAAVLASLGIGVRASESFKVEKVIEGNFIGIRGHLKAIVPYTKLKKDDNGAWRQDKSVLGYTFTLEVNKGDLFDDDACVTSKTVVAIPTLSANHDKLLRGIGLTFDERIAHEKANNKVGANLVDNALTLQRYVLDGEDDEYIQLFHECYEPMYEFLRTLKGRDLVFDTIVGEREDDDGNKVPYTTPTNFRRVN